MTDWKFDGTEDTLDSREIIERIEELEDKRAPWIAGYNMPGFMPDNDPCGFATHEEAVAYIVSCLEDHIDSLDSGETVRVANLEGTKERLESIADESEFGETVDNWHYWITYDANGGLEPEEDEELAALKALASEAESSPDWRYGETLIRDSYFTEYTKELVADCYPEIDRAHGVSTWPNYCLKMDWDMAARDLKVDYMPVEFNGSTYWIRG